MGVPTHFAHFWSNFLAWGYQHSLWKNFLEQSDWTSELERAMVRAKWKKRWYERIVKSDSASNWAF